MKRKSLRELLDKQKIVRVLEVHNSLTGLIVENLRIHDGNQIKEFDAMWSSSLIDSTCKGKPDIEVVDITSRLTNINDIFEVTTKPLIFDADTGGRAEHFIFKVRSLDRLGVSAVIIEDKTGLKRNSLFGNDVLQIQEEVDVFCEKISAGKQAKTSAEFMVIARIESLVMNKGMEDAIKRAAAYIEAGADALMIHSIKNEPDEIFEFCQKFNQFSKKIPLVSVPTTYNKVTEMQLIDAGISIVIYANHMLRSAYPSMINVAKSILKHSRSADSEDSCMSIKEILGLISGTS